MHGWENGENLEWHYELRPNELATDIQEIIQREATILIQELNKIAYPEITVQKVVELIDSEITQTDGVVAISSKKLATPTEADLQASLQKNVN